MLCVAIASSRSVIAFPQVRIVEIVKTFYTFYQLNLELINCWCRTKNDGLTAGKVEIQTIRSTFSVDGFVFDGPADGRNVASTTSSSPTPSMTTRDSSSDSRYDQCIATCRVSHESPWNFRSFSSFLLFYRGGLLKRVQGHGYLFVIPVILV